MLTLGILGSGSGSNMQAILDAIEEGRLIARIGLVLSDNPEAYILERAKARGIPTGVIDCAPHRTRFPDKKQEETACRLKSAGVDLICLAGFLRLVKSPLLDGFPSAIINIHPSLLPAFPGLNAWKQALQAGVAETGVTVHLVDEGMDTGPVLGREAVPVLPEDTPETLHARLQVVEHRLYPDVIGRYARTLQP